MGECSAFGRGCSLEFVSVKAQATIQKKVAAIGLGRLTKSLRRSLIVLELLKHGWVSAVGWGLVGWVAGVGRSTIRASFTLSGRPTIPQEQAPKTERFL